MALRFYNTLSRSIEGFKPLNPPHVGIYTCGPTVYDYAHIGNLRAFLTADILVRALAYSGFQVRQVMNITDLDDKTIKGSQNAKENIKDFTLRYEAFFKEDLNKLNILTPEIMPRASENIKAMILLIEKLIKKSYAYKADDGIYFSIKKAHQYGMLARLETRKKTRARIINDEYDKENVKDFALWKFYKKEDGDVSWDAPFGRGRPGWHIECSAMSMKYLGNCFDIHTGGTDLVFPHHTNEIAQSECVTGKNFVNYWIHSAFVTVSGGKMAKSEGTGLRLKDIVEKGFSPIAYRLLLLGAHYRTTINFTWEALSGAQTALNRISLQLQSIEGLGQVNKNYRAKFKSFINNDLDTPRALSLVWEILKDGNVDDADKKATIIDFDKVMGLGLSKLKPLSIPSAVQALLNERERARKATNWQLADKIRQKIEDLGYLVNDTEKGPRVVKKAHQD